MFETLLVGAGGFIGSIARYLVYKATEAVPTDFPLATLTVNGLASFVLGLILGITAQSELIPERLRLFIVVGILGGFSTFSAFSGETLTLLQNRSYMLALLNVFLNVSVCLASVAIGFAVTNGIPVREVSK